MPMRNANNPTWEAVTASDTAAQNYYGLLIGAAGNVTFKSESTGSDIVITGATAGQQIMGRVVLVKTTALTATVYGAKAI